MPFSALIKFKEDNETYITITTTHQEYPHDMALEAIFNMLAILAMGDHTFDDEIIDRLISRCEELRDK